MIYIMLFNLQVVFFYIYFLIKKYMKIFIFCFAIYNIIIYYIIIILNLLYKIDNDIKFLIVKR